MLAGCKEISGKSVWFNSSHFIFFCRQIAALLPIMSEAVEPPGHFEILSGK
jgi:hypothetical protein